MQVRTSPCTIADADGHAQTVCYTLNFNSKHVHFEPKHIQVIGPAGVLDIKGLRYQAELTNAGRGVVGEAYRRRPN